MTRLRWLLLLLVLACPLLAGPSVGGAVGEPGRPGWQADDRGEVTGIATRGPSGSLAARRGRRAPAPRRSEATDPAPTPARPALPPRCAGLPAPTGDLGSPCSALLASCLTSLPPPTRG